MINSQLQVFYIVQNAVGCMLLRICFHMQTGHIQLLHLDTNDQVRASKFWHFNITKIPVNLLPCLCLHK